jgi:signal transduction histidine kinase
VGEGIYEYRADDPLVDVLRQQRAWDQIERARRRVGPMGASLRLDLNDAFRRWMLAEGGALRAQGIRILSLLAPDLSPAAGDPVEVSRALRALWRDARVALRPAGGTITLRTWEDDGYVHCAVANDGSGVGAGRPSTAFRSLARPDDPPAHEASEEGMKRAGEVLEKLGGRLDVEVRPRVWTRRTVLVPATVVGPKVDHVDGAVRSADATPLGGRKMARAVEE